MLSVRYLNKITAMIKNEEKKPSLESEGFSQQGGKNELAIRSITKTYTVIFRKWINLLKI